MDIDYRINGKTGLLGLIGNPIEHTISPQLHNTVSCAMNFNQIYIPIKATLDLLEDAVKGLRALGFKGFNVTIPFKNEVMKYLDEISPDALFMGAVNTVKINDGKLSGYNTDGDGFVKSFTEETGVGFNGLKVAVIGAGGTARALSTKIASERANKVYIINRTLSNAVEIAQIINTKLHNESTDSVAESFSLDDKNAAGVLTNSDIIINTTSMGMHPNEQQMPISESFCFKSSQIVYDVIYNPIKTRFLQKAESEGCKIVNGLGMLFYQGIFANEIWNDIKIPEDVLKEVKINLFRGQM